MFDKRSTTYSLKLQFDYIQSLLLSGFKAVLRKTICRNFRVFVKFLLVICAQIVA